jgi:hypothetical protein
MPVIRKQRTAYEKMIPSKALIEMLLEKDNLTEEELDRLYVNNEYIKSQMQKPEVVEAGNDLSGFEAVCEQADTKLMQADYEPK